ncbi:hypothetical protein Q3O60_10800 [Alkalimonas collagenimarina]|uniref:Uncharacterized protein n=1 Tax=Alkalimonas collagenimarina TaxID=400390 RepID=A0ABT9H0S0_9GAMM|nr:hypothetical protein [Alkalimonas collagenimarina]MDP4536679.1 hypothetical protein [Alkalimonas collagenimarina]
MAAVISKKEAIALLKHWQNQGHSLLPLFRVQKGTRGTLVITLPDYVSNQWLTVKGNYSSYEMAMAAFGQWLDGFISPQDVVCCESVTE